MSRTTTPNPSTEPEAGIAGAAQAPAICLDTCHVENWRSDTQAAIMNPHADVHAKFAWLYGQVTEIDDLLWGYATLSNNAAGERAPAVAHALCMFIETRMTTMKRMLEAMCEQTQYEGQGGTKT